MNQNNKTDLQTKSPEIQKTVIEELEQDIKSINNLLLHSGILIEGQIMVLGRLNVPLKSHDVESYNPNFNVPNLDWTEVDINNVMEEASVDQEIAIEALSKVGGDPIEAIILLTLYPKDVKIVIKD